MQSLDASKLEGRAAYRSTSCSPRVISLIGRWTDRTRPIVRLDLTNRMVTKGYQKGVYERVTKGTGWRVPSPRGLRA